VNYAEVYRRGRPDRSPGNLLKRWAAGEIHAVVVTSNESLRNLFDIVGKLGQHWLYHTPLIAVSERARELARELGFARSPLVAREASDEAIVETLLRWRRNRFD
jgi:uroporphyrinogen-III synthase